MDTASGKRPNTKPPGAPTAAPSPPLNEPGRAHRHPVSQSRLGQETGEDDRRRDTLRPIGFQPAGAALPTHAPSTSDAMSKTQNEPKSAGTSPAASGPAGSHFE